MGGGGTQPLSGLGLNSLISGAQQGRLCQVEVYLNLVMPGVEILGPRPFLVTVRDSQGGRLGIGTPRFLFLSHLREGFFNDVFGDG
nr:hypothetical protein GCM10017547_13620 [Pseudarthrobacter oxydans]